MLSSKIDRSIFNFSVGYGDKVTTTVIGRTFSVVWITTGLAIFSTLTASLTNIIINADPQTSTSMLAKPVTLVLLLFLLLTFSRV